MKDNLFFYLWVGLAGSLVFLVSILWLFAKLDQFLVKRKKQPLKEGHRGTVDKE